MCHGPPALRSLFARVDKGKGTRPYLFRIEIRRVILVYAFPFTLGSRRETGLREGDLEETLSRSLKRQGPDEGDRGTS